MNHQELIAVADCEAEIEANKGFFEEGLRSVRESDAIKDEYRLDCYTRKVSDDTGAMKIEAMRKVLEAARLVYSMHPGRPFMTDYEAVVCEVGSPWAFSCPTPEDYLIYVARADVETDEGAVRGYEKATIDSIVKLMGDLHTAGVGMEFVVTRVGALCHAVDYSEGSDDKRRVTLVCEAFAEQFAEHEGAAL